MPLSAGDQIGPYEILSPIGAGGMGEVWKARDTRLHRLVAIKQLKGPHNSRFENEARAVAALNHPYICQIYDIGPDYLVLEYIEGKPIAGPLPPVEVLRLARQIADALETAHCQRLIHRDLKPANILLTSKGTAKLLDFGLAKLVSAEDATATQTAEGTVAGTAAYMAPEQAEGKLLDERSDIFSFGSVLYELISGARVRRSLGCRSGEQGAARRSSGDSNHACASGNRAKVSGETSGRPISERYRPKGGLATGRSAERAEAAFDCSTAVRQHER